MAEHPPPDPAKLLTHWMEWERGDSPPGELVKNLKRGGLRELLEELGAGSPAGRQDAAPADSSPA